MQLITSTGKLTFGKHKDWFIHNIPKQWIEWARDNVPDFETEYQWAIKHNKPIDKSNVKPIKYNAYSNKASNRGIRPPNAKRFTSLAKRHANHSTSET